MLQLETLAELQSLIDDGIEEGLTLEYKSSPSLGRDSANINELCKDVSAMANSAGGQIIYGIEEDKATHKPKAIDRGIADPKITREWIQQTLNSRIQPRIDGVNINRILLSSGYSLYVIEVPATQSGPHQSTDDKYYKRFDGMCAPMKDYEIKDVMRRGDTPVLALFFSASKPVQSTSTLGQRSIVLSIKVTLFNRNSTPAIYTSLRVFFDSRFRIVEHGDFNLGKEVSLGQENVVAISRNFAPPGDFPIFRETPPDAIEVKIATTLPVEPSEYFVAAHIATPGYSRLYRGSILVDHDNVTVTWPD